MPQFIVHAPASAFSPEARQSIVSELTDFALACEALPLSPFVKSTVWTYFNECSPASVFMGDKPAWASVVSVQVFVIEGGLDPAAKERLFEGTTAIFGRYLDPLSGHVPVYVIVHEIPECNWGIFGARADLAAFRASPLDAPAL